MTRSRGITIGIAVIAAVAVGITTWFIVFRDTPATGEIGAGVRIVNTAPRELKASASNKKPPVQKGLGEFISATYDIGPSGPLAAPTTLELPLNRKASSKERLAVFTAPAGGTWSVLPAKLMPGGRSVQVTTTHLSLFSVVSLKAGQLTGEFKKLLRSFYDDLSSGATAEAKPPACKDEQTARKSLTITSDHGNTVFWCLGTEDGKQVVKIVNNRRYALVGDFSHLKVLQRGSSELRLDQLAKYLEKDSIVLFARDQASFEVQLPGGFNAAAKLKLAASGKALFFNTVQAVVETALRVLSLVGLKVDAVAVTESILGNAKCLDSLRSPEVSAGKVIVNCFDEQQIMAAFGKSGLVLAPVMLLGGVAEAVRSLTNAFFDNLNGRDKYTLVISRQGGKAISFRGMTIQVPQSWKQDPLQDSPEDYDLDGIPLLTDSDCTINPKIVWSGCPAIYILGPKEIATAHEHEKFNPSEPYYPNTDMRTCALPKSKTWPFWTNRRLRKSGFAKIGQKTAIYREWAVACGSSKTGSPPYKVVGRMTQRTWYLPQSQILIVDEWNTPGLPEILANATWE